MTADSPSSAAIFAENVRRLRKEQGLTQRELAAKSDCDPGTVAGIERCLHAPSLTTADRIAAALGTATVMLLTRPDGDT